MTIPTQDHVQASNVAIYDVNDSKWLNLDRSVIDTVWSTNLIREATTRGNDDLVQAFLTYAITSMSNKASMLCSYVSSGISNKSRIWTDFGEPTSEERKVIALLCRSEFNIDATSVLEAAFDQVGPASGMQKGMYRTENGDESGQVEKLEAEIASEERRIREFLESVRSRIG